jgi:acyl-CoA synthetase (AMP-forming)/AMP-acid ligase II
MRSRWRTGSGGTTGHPKGAILSHRAELARYLLVPCEYDVTLSDTTPQVRGVAGAALGPEVQLRKADPLGLG